MPIPERRKNVYFAREVLYAPGVWRQTREQTSNRAQHLGRRQKWRITCRSKSQCALAQLIRHALDATYPKQRTSAKRHDVPHPVSQFRPYP